MDQAARRRQRSWAPEPAPGAYSMIPAWTTGAAWFDALMDALATPEGDAVRRGVSVARDTLLRVARHDWLAADVTTGRGVTTAHATVAAALGMSKRHVQRAREIVDGLGYGRTVMEGSYLTAQQRRDAREHHGGFQLRAASTRALTIPRSTVNRQPVENVHLPCTTKALNTAPVIENLTTRVDALEKSFTSSKAAKTNKQATRPVPAVEDPRPLGTQQLAGRLAARIPWLARGRHIGQLIKVLDQAGVTEDRWSADDLMESIARFTTRTNTKITDPQMQRNPLGYFAWLLRSSIDREVPTPRELHIASRADRDRRQRLARNDRKAEQLRIAAIDQGAVDLVLAQMKLDDAARTRAARHTVAGDDYVPAGSRR